MRLAWACCICDGFLVISTFLKADYSKLLRQSEDLHKWIGSLFRVYRTQFVWWYMWMCVGYICLLHCVAVTIISVLFLFLFIVVLHFVNASSSPDGGDNTLSTLMPCLYMFLLTLTLSLTTKTVMNSVHAFC